MQFIAAALQMAFAAVWVGCSRGDPNFVEWGHRLRITCAGDIKGWSFQAIDKTTSPLVTGTSGHFACVSHPCCTSSAHPGGYITPDTATAAFIDVTGLDPRVAGEYVCLDSSDRNLSVRAVTVFQSLQLTVLDESGGVLGKDDVIMPNTTLSANCVVTFWGSNSPPVEAVLNKGGGSETLLPQEDVNRVDGAVGSTLSVRATIKVEEDFRNPAVTCRIAGGTLKSVSFKVTYGPHRQGAGTDSQPVVRERIEPLNCNVDSCPAALYTWFLIADNETALPLEGESGSVLKAGNVSTYRCVAVNPRTNVSVLMVFVYREATPSPPWIDTGNNKEILILSASSAGGALLLSILIVVIVMCVKRCRRDPHEGATPALMAMLWPSGDDNDGYKHASSIREPSFLQDRPRFQLGSQGSSVEPSSGDGKWPDYDELPDRPPAPPAMPPRDSREHSYINAVAASPDACDYVIPAEPDESEYHIPEEPAPGASKNGIQVEPSPGESKNRAPVEPSPDQSGLRAFVEPSPDGSKNRAPVHPSPASSMHRAPVDPPLDESKRQAPLDPPQEESVYCVPMATPSP